MRKNLPLGRKHQQQFCIVKFSYNHLIFKTRRDKKQRIEEVEKFYTKIITFNQQIYYMFICRVRLNTYRDENYISVGLRSINLLKLTVTSFTS